MKKLVAANQHIVESDNSPALRFIGKCIGGANSDERGGHWTELRLYRTDSGKYVCHRTGFTQHDGQHNRHKAEVCDTEAEVIEFFGYGWLAKELYQDAGVDYSEVVE